MGLRHSKRAKKNTGIQAQIWVETSQLKLNELYAELKTYQKYAKWSSWAKRIMIPSMHKKIRNQKRAVSYYKTLASSYRKRGLID